MTTPLRRPARLVPFVLMCGLSMDAVETRARPESAQPPRAFAGRTLPLSADAIARPWTGDFDAMVKRRVIRVLTPYSRTHYFIDRGVQRGIAYESGRLLETEINRLLKTTPATKVHVAFVPTSRDALYRALVDGFGEVIAANVTVIAAFWKQILTGLEVRGDLVVRPEGDIAWAVRKNSPKLLAVLNPLMAANRQGTLFGNEMLRRYLKSTTAVKNATSEAELTKFRSLVGLFRKYAGQYDLDYVLMVAQGYQESQLNQGAKSRVGAIGVMQVMPATARDLNVGDITKLEPNVHAGVKYIRFMIDRYFASEPMDALNKTLFAFAAYNAGPARVRQLRREAAARGLDPNRWFNHVERVAAERVGREPVQYVSNIYKYYVAYSLTVDEWQLGK